MCVSMCACMCVRVLRHGKYFKTIESFVARSYS